MIFSRESRARVAAAERQWVAKFVLRIITLVFGIAAIGVSAAVWATGFGFVYLSIPLGVSIIWNAANIIVRLSRARPMHPGANVAVDLLLWLAFVVCLAFAYIVGVLFLIDASDYYSYDDSYYYGDSYGDPSDVYTSCGIYGGYGQEGQDFCAQLVNAGKLTIAGDAIATLCLIFHFMFFVWACVDTHRRNRGDVNAQAAIIAQQMVSQMQYGQGQGQPGVMNPHQSYMVPQQQQPGMGMAMPMGYQQPQMQQQQQSPYTSLNGYAGYGGPENNMHAGPPQQQQHEPAASGALGGGGADKSMNNNTGHASYGGTEQTSSHSPVSPPLQPASPPPQVGSPPPQLQLQHQQQPQQPISPLRGHDGHNY